MLSIKIKSENRVRFNNHLLTYVAYMCIDKLIGATINSLMRHSLL